MSRPVLCVDLGWGVLQVAANTFHRRDYLAAPDTTYRSSVFRKEWIRRRDARGGADREYRFRVCHQRHGALALKLGEQLSLTCRCRLFLRSRGGIGRGNVRVFPIKVALRRSPRRHDDGTPLLGKGASAARLHQHGGRNLMDRGIHRRNRVGAGMIARGVGYIFGRFGVVKTGLAVAGLVVAGVLAERPTALPR
jgi:hypothetical protein